MLWGETMNWKEKQIAHMKTRSYWIYAVCAILIVLGNFLIQSETKKAVIDIIALLGFIYACCKSDNTKRQQQILIGLYILALAVIVFCTFFWC